MPDQSAAAPAPSIMLLQYVFPFAVMFLIFYLIVFRPQAKARKEHEGMLNRLKKNDEVVTSGGIFGTVVNVKTESVTLRIDDNVRVEVERSAIARVVKPRSSNGEPVTVERRA